MRTWPINVVPGLVRRMGHRINSQDTARVMVRLCRSIRGCSQQYLYIYMNWQLGIGPPKICVNELTDNISCRHVEQLHDATHSCSECCMLQHGWVACMVIFETGLFIAIICQTTYLSFIDPVQYRVWSIGGGNVPKFTSSSSSSYELNPLLLAFSACAKRWNP